MASSPPVGLRLLTVATLPNFNTVLQCPITYKADLSTLKLVVSSRNLANQSFSALIEVADWRKNPGKIRVLEILRPETFFEGCLGLMVTDVVSDAQKTSVLGMAFENMNGTFHSKMFYFESNPQSLLTPMSGTLRVLGEQTQASERFRTTPSLARVGSQTFLLYSASEPYRQVRALHFGFPATYGIFCSKNLDVLDDSNLLWPDSGTDALASPRLDSSGSFLRYSKRKSGSSRFDYDFVESQVEIIGGNLSVSSDSARLLRRSVSYTTSFQSKGSENFLGSVGKWGSEGIVLWSE